MNLYKIFVIHLLVFQAVVSVQSQEFKNTTKASYGNFTMDQFFNIKSRILPENYSRSDLKSKGAIFFSISNDINSRIRIGGSFGSTKITSDVVENNLRIGSLNRNIYNLAVESDFIYFKRKNVQFYSVIGLGYSFGKDEYFLNTGKSGNGSIAFLSYQISPIGLKVGDKLAIFTELGFGYKGISNFGFLYKF